MAPAMKLGEKRNIENPELYAIFPYRLFGVGKPGLEIARRSYHHRLHKEIQGWQQDAIQAACLGMADEAARIVVKNFNTHHTGSRFPAFWGPNYDWVPDQDHGAVNMRGLQNMILQSEGRHIYLLPAWPDHWDLEFRLWAPSNTVITGVFKEGIVQSLKVKPESRIQDIITNKKVRKEARK